MSLLENMRKRLMGMWRDCEIEKKIPENLDPQIKRFAKHVLENSDMNYNHTFRNMLTVSYADAYRGLDNQTQIDRLRETARWAIRTHGPDIIPYFPDELRSVLQEEDYKIE